jgi:hypothetical protein
MRTRSTIGWLGVFLLLCASGPAAGDETIPGEASMFEEALPGDEADSEEGDESATDDAEDRGEGMPEGGSAGVLAAPAVDEEIRRVPTYEESVLYGAETPGGQYLRLAENYLYYSEIGTRGIGHIPLWPRGALYVGRFEIFPYLTSSLSWSSNAYESEDGDSAVIWEVGGGITGQHQILSGRGAVTFGLDYRESFYSNDYGDTSQWTGGVGLTYAFSPRLWASAGVKWEHLTDPVGIEYSDEVERDQVYPYIDVGLGDALGEGSKIQLEAGLDYSDAEFAESDYETGDFGEWDFHVKASYPFYKETTRLYVRYDYLWSDRESERINDLSGGNRFAGGIEGMLPLTQTGRLEGYVEAGYRQDTYDGSRYYEDGSDVLETDRKSNAGTWVGALGIRYYAGPRTTVDLRLERTLAPSSRGNYQIVDRGDIWITRSVMRDLMARLGAYAEHSDPSAGPSVGGYDVFRWGVGIGTRYIVTDFLDVFGDCEYSSRNTDRSEDDAGEFRVTIGVDVYFW